MKVPPILLLVALGLTPVSGDEAYAPPQEPAAVAAKEEAVKEAPAKDPAKDQAGKGGSGRGASARAAEAKDATAKEGAKDGTNQTDKDGAPAPGHSVHGESFDEGPRQAAVLMEGMGNVHLAVTTKNELAQRFFDQGVSQLHGFWYFEAERSFRQVAALDPDCAMAYWGMAMANINNQKRAAGFIKKAVPLKAKASAREGLWIDSLAAYHGDAKGDEKKRREALVAALEELSFQYPAELEAKAFLVFQIWDNKMHGVPIASRAAVEALGREVLAVNPQHPGVHHYFIHLWNTQNGDKRALTSAATGGQTAPGIAHLWHMPGHTYSSLRRYDDAAWQQEASARVDHAYTIRAKVLPDQIHNFAHNNDWLVKNLGYIGRVHDAVDLAKNMIELPRVRSKAGESYKMGRERLLATLRQFELWGELTADADSMYLAASGDQAEDIKRSGAVGAAWAAQGQADKAQAQVDSLKALRAKLLEERMAAADTAETTAKKDKKPEEEINKAVTAAIRGFRYRLDQTDSAIAEVLMEKALVAKDMGAVKEQLAKVSDLSSVRRSQVRFALGETEEALKLAREASSADEEQTRPLANLAELLWLAGKQDEALEKFEKLRALSATLDLDVPVYARLAPLAKHKGLPGDWRLPAVKRADFGERPALASLGPFRWHPSAAPEWTLKDSEGAALSLADFKAAKQPVLMVFYLGSGCSKCIEQLNVFEPLTQQFADAGIKIVAVSTEADSELHSTYAKLTDAKAFPIFSDSSLEAFKAYRAFDDFEKTPLHGVFLIDGEGLVRWQDISFEAFRDGTWLLQESKRLLRVPADRSAGVVGR